MWHAAPFAKEAEFPEKTAQGASWGYFSGIETKKIATTAITKTSICRECHGNRVILK